MKKTTVTTCLLGTAPTRRGRQTNRSLGLFRLSPVFAAVTVGTTISVVSTVVRALKSVISVVDVGTLLSLGRQDLQTSALPFVIDREKNVRLSVKT